MLGSDSQYYLPFQSENRLVKTEINLTRIREFGIVRKSRQTVSQHLHVGYLHRKKIETHLLSSGRISKLRTVIQ